MICNVCNKNSSDVYITKLMASLHGSNAAGSLVELQLMISLDTSLPKHGYSA
jgi:hypothetical protein